MDLSHLDPARPDRVLIEQVAQQLYGDFCQWHANRHLDDLPPDASDEERGLYFLTWKTLDAEQRRQWRWVARLIVKLGIRREDAFDPTGAEEEA